MRSYWTRTGPNPVIGVPLRGGKFGPTEIHKTPLMIGVMRVQAMEGQGANTHRA